MKRLLLSHPVLKKIILITLWVLICCGILIVLKKKVTPIIVNDSLTVSYPETTEVLLPGDFLEQDIFWNRSTLDSIDIAFSYSDTISDDTQAKISVLRNGSAIAEQTLHLTSLPNGQYIHFYLDQADCSGSTFTIRVENVSEDLTSGFSMLCTDNAHFYLDNVSDYRQNGIEHNARLLCQMYYIRSYAFYKAIVGIFWLLLLGTALTAMLSRLTNRQ